MQEAEMNAKFEIVSLFLPWNNSTTFPLPALRCTVDVRDGSAQFVL